MTNTKIVKKAANEKGIKVVDFKTNTGEVPPEALKGMPLTKRTKVECLKCPVNFMTERLKDDGETYSCPKCGFSHMAIADESKDCDGGWVRSVDMTK